MVKSWFSWAERDERNSEDHLKLKASLAWSAFRCTTLNFCYNCCDEKGKKTGIKIVISLSTDILWIVREIFPFGKLISDLSANYTNLAQLSNKKSYLPKPTHCRPTMLFIRSPNDSADSPSIRGGWEARAHTGRPGSKKQMDELLMYALNKAGKSLN